MKKLIILFVATMVVTGLFAKKPLSVFLIGDETMAELTQSEDITPSAPVGWGQKLPQYLPADAVVENHAVDGATTKSVLDEGQWSNLLSRAGRGAVVFIQFGHHEYDEEDSRHYSSLENFENNLLQMIKEAQKKGLKVALLTPTAKKFFKDDVLYPRHGAYAEGVRRVAAHAHLPLLDVEELTASLLEIKGAGNANDYFAAGDSVRLSEQGAMTVANMVVQAAKEQHVKGF